MRPAQAITELHKGVSLQLAPHTCMLIVGSTWYIFSRTRCTVNKIVNFGEDLKYLLYN